MTKLEAPAEPADLEALIAKAKKATPGPWEINPAGSDQITVVRPNEMWGQVRVGVGRCLWKVEVEGDQYANAAYIAAASPDVVLSLCEEIKRLRASSVSPASDGVMISRERLARSIDPELMSGSLEPCAPRSRNGLALAAADRVLAALSPTSSAEPQAPDGGVGLIDGNEVWEALFSIFQGDVPKGMSDDACQELADWINAALAQRPPSITNPEEAE